METLRLPEKIRRIILESEYKIDNIGMSDSSVLILEDKVLKIQECSEEAENEYRMMLWLRGKVNIPRVLEYEIMEGKAYLLMSKCSGEMACTQQYMKQPVMQARLLANGLKQLWKVDVSECPSDWRLEHKLAIAKSNVENGLVDIEDAQPDTFGEDGFKNPEELLQWLYDNQPEEELVLSHGDFCLPNVFGEDEDISGYIDLGRTGLADKWCDIALCYRSLRDNYSGKYKSTFCSDYDDLLLFRELCIEPDWEKIRYYILLDELF
jgi:aminoglycoside phosphotransferase